MVEGWCSLSLLTNSLFVASLMNWDVAHSKSGMWGVSLKLRTHPTFARSCRPHHAVRRFIVRNSRREQRCDLRTYNTTISSSDIDNVGEDEPCLILSHKSASNRVKLCTTNSMAKKNLQGCNLRVAVQSASGANSVRVKLRVCVM